MPQAHKVKVGSTGNRPELFKTIPITKQPGRQKRVVMTFGPTTATDVPLPDLRRGDQLLVFAELEVTTDAKDPGNPGLMGNPYGYAPKVEASLLLAANGGETEKKPNKAIELARPWRDTVTHERHHGVIVFPKGSYKVPRGGLPWPGDSHINLVLSASHQRASRGDLLLVGQNEDVRDVGQDMAGIRVVRLRPGRQPAQASERDTNCLVNGVPVAKQQTLVFSRRLDGLRQGEQLLVKVRLTANASGLSYAARISTRVFLADDDDQVEPGGGVAGSVASWNGHVSKTTGFNCLPDDGPQDTLKFGVLRMIQDASGPLFLNVVAVSSDPLGGAGAGDNLEIVRSRSFLEVTRFPPERDG